MLAVLLGLLLVAGQDLSVPPPDPVPIIGGTVAETCQWPATVRLGGCSGTLVHPEIVLFAAHCGNPNSVRFGVTGDDRSIPISYCAAAPEYPEIGFDYAYCRLAQPVTDVPLVPVLMGCEREELEIGRYVKLVGYGNTSNGGGGFGTKRWIDGTIAGFPNDGRMIGIFYDDPNTGVCNGDSGGSAYVQLEDGTWRLFGITSTVPGSCGGSSQHVRAWAAVAWVERHSGLDISPCNDGDGTWNPSPDCTEFPLDPGGGDGLTWQTGCGPGPLSGVGQTCGPASGEPPDTQPPTVTIVTPSEGAVDGPVHTTAIEITAADTWGIWDVTISIDGEAQATLDAEPYMLPVVDFPEGTWEIGATARDWSGNIAEATPVILEVGQVAGTDEGSTGPSGTSSDASTSGGEPDPSSSDDETGTEPETDTDPPQTGSGEGCACRSTPDGPPWLWLILMFGVPTTRRKFVGCRWSPAPLAARAIRSGARTVHGQSPSIRTS